MKMLESIYGEYTYIIYQKIGFVIRFAKKKKKYRLLTRNRLTNPMGISDG